MEIRKYVTILEEIHMNGDRQMNPPGKRAAAIAVIKNPFAGEFVEDLTPLMDIGEELGGILGKMAVDALGIAPEKAENYGKAAIVGEKGEREHAAAILHPKLGKPFRDAVSGGKALIPSAKKVGGMGKKPQWRYRVTHKLALKFANIVLPYSMVKKNKLEEIVKHYEKS